MEIKINTRSLVRSIVVIYIILISGAWNVEIPSLVRFLVNTFLGLYGLFTVVKRKETKGGIYILFMSLILTFSMIFNRDYVGWLNYISIIWFICFGIYVSIKWGIEDFAKRYCNVLSVISSISLFCYLFRDILYQFASGFPIIQGHSVSYINYYIYLYCREAPYRNCAIFWEPGAFAVFLGIAVLFAFSYLDVKTRNKQLIIYVLSLITTGSTLAYTLILLSILIFMLTTNRDRSKIWKILFGLALTITIVLILNDIGAFQNLNDKLFFGLKTNASSRGRYIGQIADFRIIYNNPITGVGTALYTEQASIEARLLGLYWSVSANTFTSMGAIFGLPFMLIVISGLVRFYNKDNILLKIICIFFGLWVFVTEAFLFKPLLYILVMDGLVSNIRDKNQEHNIIGSEKTTYESV